MWVYYLDAVCLFVLEHRKCSLASRYVCWREFVVVGVRTCVRSEVVLAFLCIHKKVPKCVNVCLLVCVCKGEERGAAICS